MQRILCVICGEDLPKELDSEDKNDGYKQRIRFDVCYKPASHGVKVNENPIIEFPTVICDHCNCVIADGEKACFWTMWRGEEPGEWEKEYSTPSRE